MPEQATCGGVSEIEGLKLVWNTGDYAEQRLRIALIIAAATAGSFALGYVFQKAKDAK